jgi:hypothetical protein
MSLRNVAPVERHSCRVRTHATQSLRELSPRKCFLEGRLVKRQIAFERDNDCCQQSDQRLLPTTVANKAINDCCQQSDQRLLPTTVANKAINDCCQQSDQRLLPTTVANKAINDCCQQSDQRLLPTTVANKAINDSRHARNVEFVRINEQETSRKDGAASPNGHQRARTNPYWRRPHTKALA